MSTRVAPARLSSQCLCMSMHDGAWKCNDPPSIPGVKPGEQGIENTATRRSRENYLRFLGAWGLPVPNLTVLGLLVEIFVPEPLPPVATDLLPAIVVPSFR